VDTFSKVAAMFDLGFLGNYKFNVSPEYYACMVAILLILVCLFMLARTQSVYSAVPDLHEVFDRLGKIELALSEHRNKTANQTGLLESEIKSVSHDVAQIRKIMDVIFAKAPVAPEHAARYEDSNDFGADLSAGSASDQKVTHNVRISKKD